MINYYSRFIFCCCVLRSKFMFIRLANSLAWRVHLFFNRFFFYSKFKKNITAQSKHIKKSITKKTVLQLTAQWGFQPKKSISEPHQPLSRIMLNPQRRFRSDKPANMKANFILMTRTESGRDTIASLDLLTVGWRWYA